jgi:hypothetical protein
MAEGFFIYYFAILRHQHHTARRRLLFNGFVTDGVDLLQPHGIHPQRRRIGHRQCPVRAGYARTCLILFAYRYGKMSLRGEFTVQQIGSHFLRGGIVFITGHQGFSIAGIADRIGVAEHQGDAFLFLLQLLQQPGGRAADEKITGGIPCVVMKPDDQRIIPVTQQFEGGNSFGAVEVIVEKVDMSVIVRTHPAAERRRLPSAPSRYRRPFWTRTAAESYRRIVIAQ